MKLVQTIIKDIRELPWYIITLVVLYILQALYVFIPAVTIPAFKIDDPEYTYQVAYYFIVASLIDLNILYIVYTHYRKLLIELLCWIAFGHLIDQVGKAAIRWDYSEIMWILISIVFVYRKVYGKRKSDGSSSDQE